MADGSFPYVRFYVGPDGASHFADHTLDLTRTAFAPPAPQLLLSAACPAERTVIAVLEAGWVGGWHPTPARQWAFILAGEVECEVPDGEVRRLRPGDCALLEDTTGRGHDTRVIGTKAVVMALVQLSD